MASSGICRMDHTPYSVRQIVRTTISTRFCAEKSMMRLIICSYRAVMLVWATPIVFPFLRTVTVVCQVHAIRNSICPV